MMVHHRTGRWPKIGLECTMEYAYTPEQESIPVVLEFEPLGVYSNSDFKFTFPQSISDITSNDQIREFTISQGFEGGEILVANENDDNNTPQIQIDLVPARTFLILHQILEDQKKLEECIGEVESVYSSSDGPPYMNLRADAEKVLEYRPYTRLLAATSSYNVRAEGIISKNRCSYFENRLLNPREPHYVSSFGDLVNKISHYNSYEELTEVDIDEVLRSALSELFTRVENSGFDYASEIIDRILPRRTEDFGHIDKISMCIYVSIFHYSGKSTRAKQLFWNWCRHESNPNPSFVNGSQAGEIDSDSITDFMFQVAFRSIQKAQYQGTLPLFETIQKTTSADKSPRLHDLSEYHSLMQRGYGSLDENPSRARENFDEAISTLRESSVLDRGPESDRYTRSIDAKCKAVVRDYRNRSDIGSAITYLSGFIDQELSQIQSSSYLHDRVHGLRSEFIARKYTQDRALDLAVDQIDEAIQHYRSSGKRTDERQSVWLFIKRELLMPISQKLSENSKTQLKRTTSYRI